MLEIAAGIVLGGLALIGLIIVGGAALSEISDHFRFKSRRAR